MTEKEYCRCVEKSNNPEYFKILVKWGMGLGNYTCHKCGLKYKKYDEPELAREQVLKILRNREHDSMYGLFNNCPKCLYYPCLCRQIELYDIKETEWKNYEG